MTETKTTNENAQVAIDSNIDVDNQAEIITDKEDVEYLSPELITGGNLRNIVTVKLTTQTGSFCVDVLKHNRLYKIFISEYEKELTSLEKEAENNDIDKEHYAKLLGLASYEMLVENIVKPRLTLKNDEVFLGDSPVPGDILSLLMEAYKVVNTQRDNAKAVQHFQEPDGS